MDKIYYILFIDSSFGYFNDLHKYANVPNLFFGQIHHQLNDSNKKYIPVLLDYKKAIDVAQRLSIEGILARGNNWIVPLIGVIIVGYKVNGEFTTNDKKIIINETDNKHKKYKEIFNENYDIIEYTKNNSERAIIRESIFSKLVPVVASYYVKTTMNPIHAFSFLRSAKQLFGLTNHNIDIMEELYEHKNKRVPIKELIRYISEIERYNIT